MNSHQRRIKRRAAMRRIRTGMAHAEELVQHLPEIINEIIKALPGLMARVLEMQKAGVKQAAHRLEELGFERRDGGESAGGGES